MALIRQLRLGILQFTLNRALFVKSKRRFRVLFQLPPTYYPGKQG
jgi:hypothetical protein